MPIYQFKCDHPESPYYKTTYEVIWSLKEYIVKKDSLKCPITGAPMRSVMSGSALRFNGTGFYSTDYKNR